MNTTTTLLVSSIIALASGVALKLIDAWLDRRRQAAELARIKAGEQSEVRAAEDTYALAVEQERTRANSELLGRYRGEIDRLDGELAATRVWARDLQAQLDAVRREMVAQTEELRAENRVLHAENDDLRRQVADLRRTVNGH